MLSLKLTERENIIIDVAGEKIVLRFYRREFGGYDNPYIAIAAPKEWGIYREPRRDQDE